MKKRCKVTSEEAWDLMKQGSLKSVVVSDGFDLFNEKKFKDGKHGIVMTDVVIEGALHIDHLKVAHVTLDKVAIEGILLMMGTTIAKQWYMKDCHIKPDGLRASGVQVGENVIWSNVIVDHIAEVDGLTVTGTREVGFNGVHVKGLTVNGVLNLERSKAVDFFLLQQLTVSKRFSLQDLSMEGKGILDLQGLSAKGPLNLTELQGVLGLYCDRKNAARLHYAAPTIPLVY